MQTAPTLRPLADQHMDDIRREAIKAIRECLDPLALTGRILRYTDPDERLRFIRAARAYYQQQIDDCKEAGVSHCIDTLVPRLGDLTDYFKSHEKQAEAELRQRSSDQQSAIVRRASDQPTPVPEPLLVFATLPDLSGRIVGLIRQYAGGKTAPFDRMMPVRAALDAGLIRRPTFSEFRRALPDICPRSKSSYGDYMITADKAHPHPYADVEAFARMVERFEELQS